MLRRVLKRWKRKKKLIDINEKINIPDEIIDDDEPEIPDEIIPEEEVESEDE